MFDFNNSGSNETFAKLVFCDTAGEKERRLCVCVHHLFRPKGVIVDDELCNEDNIVFKENLLLGHAINKQD